MLEGLEVSVISFKDLIDNKDFRADSDFYTKIPKKNPKLKYDKIGNCLINSQYGISIEMNEDNKGYPIYRMNEIHNMMADLNVNKFADITNEEKEKFTLNDKDVLFNRTNSYEWVGRTGLYRKVNNKDFIFASYLVRFIPDTKKVLPEYLTAFLNSKQGAWDLKRRARQSINQTNINPEEVKEVEIPLTSIAFQKLIESNFEKAHKNIIQSEKLYSSAESLLLETIGLHDFYPSEEPINVKSFKDSFLETGRLDAEYYQKKYEDYVNLIKGYKNGWNKLSMACNLKDSNFTPEENKQYKYIELSNIGVSGNITGCMLEDGINLPSRARRLINTDDVIISSIEGSLESCALVQEEYDNALCSTGFYVINSSEINPQTLVVLFKSEPMQKILKKNCSGTILTAINKDEFLKLPVPIIEKSIQKKIATLVEKSFALKKESEYLLEKAKRAVEIAIENDEKIALKFIVNE